MQFEINSLKKTNNLMPMQVDFSPNKLRSIPSNLCHDLQQIDDSTNKLQHITRNHRIPQAGGRRKREVYLGGGRRV
jgi:hypothetical protein